METKVKRREWVKTAAIILLSVLLILTFFSNTIMNRSLPEVATQAVQSGSINAQIRGTGQISADETYDVTINQSRKVQSVHIRVGDEVRTGDVLFVLDPTESSELQSARDSLESMELSYQQALISASNAAAQENRNIQKLQQAYNEALAAYQMYSSSDPTKLKTQLAAAEAYLKTLNRAAEDAQKAVTDAETDENYVDAKAEYETLKTKIENLEDQIESYQEQIKELQNGGGIDTKSIDEQIAAALRAKDSAQMTLNRDKLLYLEQFQTLKAYAELSEGESDAAPKSDLDKDTYVDTDVLTRMAAYAVDMNYLTLTLENDYHVSKMTEEELEEWETENELSLNPDDATKENMANAFNTLTGDREDLESSARTLKSLEDDREDMLKDSSRAESIAKLQVKINNANYEINASSARSNALRSYLNAAEYKINALKAALKEAQEKADDQQEYYDRLQDAQIAASTLTSAKEALEDATFNLSLEDADALRLQNDKEAIDKQKTLIAQLEKEADAVEVTARVPGVISAVNISAGNTANAEMPLATITIKDRGYTVRISCTADQARRVTIGDQAKLSNYYYYGGDVSATLEKILNDPQNPQTGRYLVFRLTGDGVEPGANVTLAIGQKSASYEALVPNSAVRNDTNGNYVLVVQEKSTPLSTRYTARRVDVNVLASDDTQTAVTGLSVGDFVILTSSRPIEAGDQVRLPDDS